MAKTAIIVGNKGQDGSLLSNSLITKGYNVVGIGRKETTLNNKPVYPVVDILDAESVYQLLDKIGPSEIYYLAAHHSSSENQKSIASSADYYRMAHAVHVEGLLNFLSYKRMAEGYRLFYASSSLVFSGSEGSIQNEDTKIDPVGIYGITKAQGMFLIKEYREKKQAYATSGILYNHESHLRPLQFLTAKIIRAAISISKGNSISIDIGDPAAMVDWGYAPDYVEAFRALLSLEEPDDFIIATGEAHSIEELLDIVFNFFSLDWSDHVNINEKILFRRQPNKVGDASKLLNKTGIRLKRPFKEFIHILINDHIIHCNN